ncbi:MAG: GNAT family N-acetyltransferase [Candidatus Micrarchaeia archaeon]
MQDLNVEIKRADEKNLYSIAVLTKKYFPYAGFNFDEVLRRVNDPNVVYYAAVSNNHTVGYVDFEVKEDQIKILGLAVLKELRGRGIGRMLLRKAVVFAKKKKKSVCCKRKFAS